MLIVSRVWAWLKKYVKAALWKLREVWAWLKKYKNFRKFIFWVIVAFLSLLLFGMLWAMVSVVLYPDVKSTLTNLTEIKHKPELLKFIGLGMSGIIATLGVVGLLQRATALNEQNEISEKGHVHERFKAATEHLGNERDSVRIAAFYEFYHLAKIESDLRKTICDILCAHLRQTTRNEYYQNNEEKSDKAKSKEIELTEEPKNKPALPQNKAKSKEIEPTEEVQSLLNILFQPHNDNLIFDGLGANLEKANLQGAVLHSAFMQNTKLPFANLQKAFMPSVKLQNSMMLKANLQGAVLTDAFLQNAVLSLAKMDNVNLKGANLQNATMWYTSLERANLQNANLKDANLRNAYLRGTNLQNANLQGADLRNTFMLTMSIDAKQEKAEIIWANLQDANLQGAKINERAMKSMPENWKDIVKKDKNNKTGVLFVDDEGNVIEHL